MHSNKLVRIGGRYNFLSFISAVEKMLMYVFFRLKDERQVTRTCYLIYLKLYFIQAVINIHLIKYKCVGKEHARLVAYNVNLNWVLEIVLSGYVVYIRHL